MEHWKEIEGFPGYWVSDLGKVRHGEKLLIPRAVTYNRSYYAVRLAGGVEKYVHRLVAATFIGNIATSYVVHHKDSNSSNNALNNLEIVTPWENSMLFWQPTWYTTQTKIMFE